jgi:hypothetical protein
MQTVTLTTNASGDTPLASRAEVDTLRRQLANASDAMLLGLVGGLSAPSKMPGYAYSIPAEHCVTGSLLRKVEGSACSKCYALKGNYKRFPGVRRAMERRLRAVREGASWVAAMSLLLERYAAKGHVYFRWHDSGDIQDRNHLHNICMVHDIVPQVQGWIPTREYRILDGFDRAIPDNLTVRVSAHMIGQRAPSRFSVSSMIVPKGESVPDGVAHCPAPTQGGKCGECRNCWNSEVSTVAYTQH